MASYLAPYHNDTANLTIGADSTAPIGTDNTAPIGTDNTAPETYGSNHTSSLSAMPPTYSCENVTLFNEYFTYCSGEFQAISSIKLYSLPLFVVVGSIGNMACFAVLSQKNAMKSSMSFYMAALMILHTAVLYMGCGLEWYSFVTHKIHFLHTVDWFCRFFNFSFSVIRCAAWWILVAMTIDCYLDVWCPVKAQYMCTLFIAKFITTSIFVWLVSLHVHAMWIYEVKNGMCMLDTSRQDFETIVWPWITAIFSHYLPILLVLIFVVLVGVGSLVNQNCCDNNANNQKRFTRLTTIMAIIFLSTTLPTIIMNFIDQSQPLWQISNDPRHWKKHSQYILWQVIFSTLESFYVSFCFLLFFLVFPALRSELRNLLRNMTCCQPRSRDNLLNANNEQLMEINNVKSECPQNNRTTLV
ncbi:hypothetical protein LSH36_88g01000 [Paralvinella palmiformis]|uniref:G-protein coupled receptors family 1 profile domain-containing protein n=1 Tax=Paralvinella palmiformis TaxID=53620 RepID=A0AAD9K173_9ANNE|nr:hypothetical protein LSH36_88g01000 [Paralvinella palmiformis]